MALNSLITDKITISRIIESVMDENTKIRMCVFKKIKQINFASDELVTP